MSISYKVLAQKLYSPEYSYSESATSGTNSGYGYGYGYGGSQINVNESIVPQTLYEVPQGKQAIVTMLFVLNSDSTARTTDIFIVENEDSSITSGSVFRNDLRVEPFSSKVIDTKITLSSGDRVVVMPSTINKVCYTMFGVELDVN